MGGRRGAAVEELMTRPQHVCPNKGCRGYALGGDDEQEGARHHRRRGDDALVLLQESCFASEEKSLALFAIYSVPKPNKSKAQVANCDGGPPDVVVPLGTYVAPMTAPVTFPRKGDGSPCLAMNAANPCEFISWPFLLSTAI